MPNWCENLVIIEGNTKQLSELLKKYTSKGEGEQCIDFELIAPTPKELSDNSAPLSVSDKEKAKEFKKKYGAEDWYNWNNKNWGTKWNTSGYSFEDNGTSLEFGFDTAWAPPIPIIKKLSKLYPDLKFTITYAEPGCCIAGKHIFKHGKEIFHKYTEDIKDKLFAEFGCEFDEDPNNNE